MEDVGLATRYSMPAQSGTREGSATAPDRKREDSWWWRRRRSGQDLNVLPWISVQNVHGRAAINLKLKILKNSSFWDPYNASIMYSVWACFCLYQTIKLLTICNKWQCLSSIAFPICLFTSPFLQLPTGSAETHVSLAATFKSLMPCHFLCFKMFSKLFDN